MKPQEIRFREKSKIFFIEKNFGFGKVGERSVDGHDQVGVVLIERESRSQHCDFSLTFIQRKLVLTID